MNAPHLAVTPGLIEAADRNDHAAIQRALAHCNAWIEAGHPLPPTLRAWLYRRAATLVCDSLVVEVGP